MAGTERDPERHYDRITPVWEVVLGPDFHHGLFTSGQETLAEATRALTDALASLAGLAPGRDPARPPRVLDVGCGSGGPACVLAAQYGAEVTAITTSAAGVAASRARVAEAGLAARVAVERRDGLETGLSGGGFDVVWMLESALYIEPRERLIGEAVRLLAPGGRLVIAEPVLLRELDLRDLRRLREPFAAVADVFGESRLAAPGVYRSLCADAGLQLIAEESVGDAVRPTFARWRESAELQREETIRLAGDSWWRRFLDGCAALDSLFNAGLVGYVLIAARRS